MADGAGGARATVTGRSLPRIAAAAHRGIVDASCSPFGVDALAGDRAIDAQLGIQRASLALLAAQRGGQVEASVLEQERLEVRA